MPVPLQVRGLLRVVRLLLHIHAMIYLSCNKPSSYVTSSQASRMMRACILSRATPLVNHSSLSRTLSASFNLTECGPRVQSIFHVSFLRGLFPESSYRNVEMGNLGGASLLPSQHHHRTLLHMLPLICLKYYLVVRESRDRAAAGVASIDAELAAAAAAQA